jgi:arsenate reductase-like glutaredoxin family protein
MTKKEIKNIIQKGFQERRERQKARNAKNSALTKAWKLRESLLDSASAQEIVEHEEIIKRKKHFLTNSEKKKNN